MRRLLVFLIALVSLLGAATPSLARVEVENFPCTSSTDVARETRFYQDGSDQPYYAIIIYCDLDVEEWWGGSIGQLPQPTSPWTWVGEETATGGWIDRMMVGTTEVARITYDGVPGHHAVVIVHP